MLSVLMRHFGVDEHTKVFVLYTTHSHFLVDGKRVPLVSALPTWIQKLFVRWGRSPLKMVRWLFDYRNLMFFYPLLCWLLRKKIKKIVPDELIISSFATAKNVVPVPWWHIPTILYLHSPMQYIWENYDEYVSKLSWIKNILFRAITILLRPWDKQYRKYTTIYANSNYTASCAKQYYQLSAQLWYPPLDKLFWTASLVVHPRDYFVYIGRLVRFIREVDRIIMLCNDLHLPLLVVGDGPDEEYLHSIAWPTITFVGYVRDVAQKIEILKHARWLLNLAKESCGIATMEALCLWVPVFGYALWGTRELVLWDDTFVAQEGLLISSCGILVSEKTSLRLKQGMQAFASKNREREKIQTYAREKFSCFSRHLQDQVNSSE